ncbi:hypothetical protein PENTCL1PPCAC_9870 [Pristionchus entomophagus]|uniref:Carboxylic ester hydrolase n=1 Tax=Pristionchus entomophagus TaxID=358040 RepID=A0AAV5SX24_9BILA|nr:hypothetical protein PENTCL1PPCAC_9870 [Pristionchus entomophagus]
MASLLILTIFCPFVLAATGLSFDDAAGTVHLKISQGELLGKRIDAYESRTGYGFLGIPFGAPPVGPLRFAKPVAASSWEGVRNVTVKGDACPAVGELTYKRPEGGPMSEDCLHTYVYASKNCLTKGGCPIMWVLHGGRYNFESPVVFVDDVIVHNFASDGQDVVVIIPAYRLENFGFLNIAPGMNTSATPNTAVWDLLLALQWTRREAHYFGGDPKKITVFGHSAGAQFADVISVSPHFKGLFNGMVMMSGADTAFEAGYKSNSLASWVTATILGCATDSTDRSDVVAVEAVIECMREKTWQEIVAANEELNTHPEDYHGPHADGPGGILPLSPSQLALTRPPVRTMIGTTAAEFHDTKYALNADGTANLKKVAELCEGFGYAIGYKHPEVMTKLCLDYYMQGRNVMSLQQDSMFFMPTFETARRLMKKGNKVTVFLYSFTYKGVEGAFKKYMPLDDKDDHPSHSEDYVYILGMHRGNFTPKDYEIENIYSGMVLNFVKTGNPSLGKGQPAWKPFNKIGRNYYEIDFNDALRMPGMKKGYQAGAVKLWVDDAEKYGGPITPPEELVSYADRFNPMDMVTAYASHYLNDSLAHDKTLESEQDQYKIWADYINNRRFKHLQGKEMYLMDLVDKQESTRSVNVVTGKVQIQASAGMFSVEILVICVSAILIFLLLRCCLHCVGVCQERKGYEEF